MTLPLRRYPLDPTGLNPDNLVIGETAVLTQRPVRAVTPIYGPFFADSVELWDSADNRLLVKNVDYKTVEILQDACLKFGKEVVSIILIFDTNVTGNVIYNYQVLGGLYQYYGPALNNMYETAIQDNRPIDWVNVLNKPVLYPPTIHRHLLEDVFGWEEVVLSLERIRSAMTLSNLPAFESLVDWVNDRFNNFSGGGCDCPVVTESEIDNVTPSNKFVTFDMLLYAIDKLNFNGLKLLEKYSLINNGDVLPFTLCSTNTPDGTIYYWTIENITTNNADFGSMSGLINMNDNIGNFLINVTPVIGTESNEKFKVAIRKGSVTGPILLTTGQITIAGTIVSPVLDFIDYINACCVYNPNIDVSPESLFLSNRGD